MHVQGKHIKQGAFGWGRLLHSVCFWMGKILVFSMVLWMGKNLTFSLVLLDEENAAFGWGRIKVLLG